MKKEIQVKEKQYYDEFVLRQVEQDKKDEEKRKLDIIKRTFEAKEMRDQQLNQHSKKKQEEINSKKRSEAE
jgi:hypothetical protein